MSIDVKREAKEAQESAQQAANALKYVGFYDEFQRAEANVSEKEAWDFDEKWLLVAKAYLEEALRQVESMEKVH